METTRCDEPSGVHGACGKQVSMRIMEPIPQSRSALNHCAKRAIYPNDFGSFNPPPLPSWSAPGSAAVPMPAG